MENALYELLNQRKLIDEKTRKSRDKKWIIITSAILLFNFLVVLLNGYVSFIPKTEYAMIFRLGLVVSVVILMLNTLFYYEHVIFSDIHMMDDMMNYWSNLERTVKKIEIEEQRYLNPETKGLFEDLNLAKYIVSLPEEEKKQTVPKLFRRYQKGYFRIM